MSFWDDFKRTAALTGEGKVKEAVFPTLYPGEDGTGDGRPTGTGDGTIRGTGDGRIGGLSIEQWKPIYQKFRGIHGRDPYSMQELVDWWNG